MSTSSITITALGVAVAAMTILLLSDARQTARTDRRIARATRRGHLEHSRLIETPTRLYRPTPIWRRIVALFEMGLISVVVAAFIAAALAVAVIGALLLLRQAVR